MSVLKGAHIPGVSWMTDKFQVFDNGLIIEKGTNGTFHRRTRGLVAFGIIDERNIFHLLPLRNGKFVDWEIIRSIFK